MRCPVLVLQGALWLAQYGGVPSSASMLVLVSSDAIRGGGGLCCRKQTGAPSGGHSLFSAYFE